MVHSVMETMMVLKSQINYRQKVANPWKFQTSVIVLGVGYSCITHTFSLSAWIFSTPAMNYRNTMLSVRNVHLSMLMYSLFICKISSIFRRWSNSHTFYKSGYYLNTSLQIPRWKVEIPNLSLAWKYLVHSIS